MPTGARGIAEARLPTYSIVNIHFRQQAKARVLRETDLNTARLRYFFLMRDTGQSCGRVTASYIVGLERRIAETVPVLGVWSGFLHRFCSPAFARRPDRLEGVGAALHGGRWNPIGVPALYASFEEETAMAESRGTAARYGFSTANLKPLTLFHMDANDLEVLDLGDGALRNRLRLGARRLKECDWRRPPAIDAAGTVEAEPLTQAVGRVAARLGVQAIRVPSARVSGRHNLVIFPRNLTPPARVSALHPDLL